MTGREHPWLSRRQAVIALLTGGVAVLALTPATWLRTTGSSPVQASVRVAVSGQSAAPGASAAALVAVAGALALGIVGPIARYVVLAVVAAAGAAIVASALAVTTHPGPGARAAVADRTGVDAIGSVHVAAAGWGVAAVGLALVAVAVWALVACRRWPSVSRRHETPRTRAARGLDDDRDAWDALSAGDDPTREVG